MTAVHAVIGAGFGDEGKGLLVDRLAGRDAAGTIVVRHNGGAQAGHTVERGSLRHVFKHHGSGTLAGAATYWSRFCVVNPVAFSKERRHLRRLGVNLPPFLCSPEAPMSTMIDMVINQAVEAARGAQRHGSCGMGINEVVTRAASTYPTLRFRDVFDLSPAELSRKLDAVRYDWAPARCAELGIPVPKLILDRELDRMWLDAVDDLLVEAIPAGLDALHTYRAVVFEGAQGLRLDEVRGTFPYVTRSRTGLTNVVELVADAGLPPVSPWYVTRWYLTRHGAGPLAHECTREELSQRIVDETNQPNPHQGALRFAPLDMDALALAITTDFGEAADQWPVKMPRIIVTCLNHLPLLNTAAIPLADGRRLGAGELARELAERTGISIVGFAAGSAAANVEECVNV